MMIKKMHILLLLVAFVVSVGPTGCYRKSPEQRAEGIVKAITDKLDLNESQKARLDAMRQEFLAKRPAMKKTREETFDRLITMMRASSLDKSSIASLAEQNKAQADDLIGFLFSKYSEFHAMLSPGQREKAAQEMERWREKYREFNEE